MNGDKLSQSRVGGTSNPDDVIVKRSLFLRPFYDVRFFMVIFFSQTLLQGVQGSYLNAIITTLEKRFSWHSSETGFLVSTSTIGNAAVTIFVGHFGRRWHKPRVFAICLLTSCAAAILDALPHFLFGPGSFGSSTVNIRNVTSDVTKTASVFCESETPGRNMIYDYKSNITHLNVSVPGSDVTSASTESVASYWIIFVAELLYGASGSPFFTLGITFLDDIISRKRIATAIGKHKYYN